uniref:Uncharacterized protein n=1 Tax=Rhizophora mucronata TaxID=61149 RepID=A0A2P2QK05_RHIMU
MRIKSANTQTNNHRYKQIASASTHKVKT